jgi:hypothetical protein
MKYFSTILFYLFFFSISSIFLLEIISNSPVTNKLNCYSSYFIFKLAIFILWNDLPYFLWCSLYCKLGTVKEVQGVELKLVSWLYNDWLYLQLQYLSFHALQYNPWPSVASLCVWYFCYYPYSNNMKLILFQQKCLPWNWKWQVSNLKM